MKKNPDPPADPAALRRRAEQRLQTRQQTPPSPIRNPQSAIRNPQSAQRLVHDLQVHQIELEMQNEELQRARARAEALLAQYTDLYDFAPVGYLTLNEPGLIQEANLTAANLLGVARSELRQRPLSRFVLREDADIYDRHRRQLLETRAPQSCELRMKRPGATPFWVRLEASVPPGSGGAPPVCRATLSDITRHKQAEADRERLVQLERLAQLMKCANDVILLTDEDGRILEANDRALETYGYSLAELRQKTVEDLRTPESRAELPHQAEQLETDGRAVYEAMNQRRDGVAFPVEISARFLQIAGVRYRLGIVRDITERQGAQEALRESEQHYRAVVEDQTEVICRFRSDGTITFVNDVYCRFFGKSLQELIGQKWQPKVFPADLSQIEEKLRTLAPSNPVVVIENRVYSASSQMHWMQFVNRGFFDGGGRLIETQAVGRDITERKRAEERVQMLSREIIVAREEERKRVSSVLHHDVGSMAVGVAAHLDALEEDLRSGRAREALKWMRRTRKLFGESVVRLKKLAIELRPPELDVLGLCAALRQHFAQAAEPGGIRIHFRETLGRRRVSGDTATILFRIAQEALTNAITHGHATRVDVGLSASKTEVALTARNNGKAFNPSGKTGRVKSHLGLRVMREMALSAGGVFTVDSGRGKGTTVRVRLPIADCGMRIADSYDCGMRIADCGLGNAD